MTTRPISLRSLAQLAFGCALALAGSGCLGSSPDPRFYALPSLSDGVIGEERRQLGIGVGPVDLPRYLQRPQIATRRGDSRVDYDEVHRWAGSLESDTLRVVGENLGILLGTDRVVVYPHAAPFPTRYRIRLQVERFDGRRGETVDLRVRWIITSSASGQQALAVETTQLQEKLDSGSVDELVRGHGRALAELSRAIAARVIALEAELAPPGSGAAPEAAEPAEPSEPTAAW